MSQLKKLQSKLSESNIPGLIVSNISNVRWVSGFTGSSAFVLVSPTEAVFITDGRYILQSANEVKEMPIEITTNERGLTDILKERAEAFGLNRLAVEGDSVTINSLADWQKKLEGIELFGEKDIIGRLRMVKSPAEIATLRRACGLTDACFDHIRRLLQIGTREIDIAIEIEFFFKRQGADKGFDPIVVSGDRSALPHGKPSEKALAKGDFVTMDFGAKVDGYTADITRTVVISEASDRHREIYAAVEKAQQAGIKNVVAGASAKTPDEEVRKVFSDAGMVDHFTHGLGHGIGLVVHDAGRLSVKSEDIIETGQVWTVEPGVYYEGFGGCRIEDDVLVLESGNEILTKAPRELLVL